MRNQDIALRDLILDPNNYRLQDSDSFSLVNENRFAEQGVQDRTLEKIMKHSIKDLVRSIRSNGFLEIERIIVTPYAPVPDKYLIIEGNRRVAALLQLRNEHLAGIDVPQNVIARFEAVPCLVADGGREPFFKEALMGIRHVGGIKEWGGYQRAKLIADLRDRHNLEAGDVADRLGMNVQEVNRRYRAFKTLQQFQDDEEFGEYASPSMYPIFHEAVSLPVLRDWIGWNQDRNLFEHDDNRRLFYELITPVLTNEGEDGADERPAKVRTYEEVRQLRDIIPNDEARACLLQRDKSLLDAQTIAKRDEISKQWRAEIGEAMTALQKMSAFEVRAFDKDDIKILQNLIDITNQIINMNGALQKK